MITKTHDERTEEGMDNGIEASGERPLSTFLTDYTQYKSMILNRESWTFLIYYIPRIRNEIKNEVSIFHKKLQLMPAIFRIS